MTNGDDDVLVDNNVYNTGVTRSWCDSSLNYRFIDFNLINNRNLTSGFDDLSDFDQATIHFWLQLTVDWCIVHYNKGSIEVLRLEVNKAAWPGIRASLSLSPFLHFHWQSEAPSICLNRLHLHPHPLDFQPTSWQPETSQSLRTIGSTWI